MMIVIPSSVTAAPSLSQAVGRTPSPVVESASSALHCRGRCDPKAASVIVQENGDNSAASVSALVLACFLICSVAWTYDAYAGEDPLLSAQGSETDDDAMPSSDTGELPALAGGGYCNLGCHLAGHLRGPVASILPVVLALK